MKKIILLGLLCFLLIPSLSYGKKMRYLSPKSLIPIIKKYHKNYKLVLAMIYVESSFNPKAVSGDGSVGLMQVHPRTAWRVYRVKRKYLFNPEINIKIGCKYLKYCQKRSYNNEQALLKYTGGNTDYWRKVYEYMQKL